jgi:hypothetical protein
MALARVKDDVSIWVAPDTSDASSWGRDLWMKRGWEAEKRGYKRRSWGKGIAGVIKWVVG